MGDDWFGHRDPLTWEKTGDKDEWIDWDHILANVLQTIEDFSDQHGLLQWQLDDDAVVVDAVKKIHPFEAARDRKTGHKNYKSVPGEYYVPRLKSRREGGKMQTFREWVEAQAEEAAESQDE